MWNKGKGSVTRELLFERACKTRRIARLDIDLSKTEACPGGEERLRLGR